MKNFLEKLKAKSEFLVDKFATVVVKKRLWFTIIFSLLFIAFGVCFFFVNTNYDSTVYLPNGSEVKEGLSTMYDEFGEYGNASIMIADERTGERKSLKYADAIAIKNQLLATNGIKDALWVDDLFASITSNIDGDYSQVQYGETILILIDVISNSDLSMLDSLNLENVEINKNNVEGLISSALFIFKNKIDEEISTGNYDIDYDILVNVTKTMMVSIVSKEDVAFSSFNVNDISSMIEEFKTSLDMFYAEDKDGNKCALYQITFTGSDYANSTMDAIDEVRENAIKSGYGLYMSGNSATTYNSIDCVSKQTTYAFIAVVIVVLIILYLFSTSYWEPILYLSAIAVAVIINMGSNIFMGGVSYLTSGVAGILQLALSMDYSIFLLSRFKQEKEKTPDVEEAMINAIKASIKPISASSLTTIASFVAIMFMSYTIGLDMGIVFAKGVILSLLCVFMLLPGIAIYTNKWTEKSKHKSFKLSFNKYTNVLMKIRYVIPIVAIVVIVFGFIGQNYITFGYGDTATFGSEGSLIYEDKKQIENVFGRQNQLAILISKDVCTEKITINGKETSVETAIISEISQFDFVITAQSLSIIEESGMSSVLPNKFLMQFDNGGEYRRLVTYIDLDEEGEATESAIKTIRQTIEKYGAKKGDYYLLGGSSSAIEIKEIVNVDYDLITYVSIGLVALILLLTFRNVFLPIILVLVIQGSVWISMSINVLTGDSLVFLGYLIVSAVMLGATIDYGILLTSNYNEARKTQYKFDAIKTAISKSSRAILTSSIILCAVGYSIGLTSSMPAITVFGQLVGRTALTSLILVFALLPTLLVIFDKLIIKTTLGKCDFLIEPKKNKVVTATEAGVDKEGIVNESDNTEDKENNE